MAQDEKASTYQHYLDLTQHWPAPIYWLPGNHDNCHHMMSIGGHPIEREYQTDGWQFIFLNSQIPGEEGGRLGDRELERLQRSLNAHPELSCAVFLHHQPVAVGSEWVDQYVLEDAQAFFDVIDQYPQVKLISWGHVHQYFSVQRNGVQLLATPSTCVQFLPNSDQFQVDNTMPGYRCYDFAQQGHFSTRVERCEARDYQLDMSATGY